MLIWALASWCQLIEACSVPWHVVLKTVRLTDSKKPTVWKASQKTLVSSWQQRSQIPSIMWMWVDFNYHWGLMSCIFLWAHWSPCYHFSHSWSFTHTIPWIFRLFRESEKGQNCRKEHLKEGISKAIGLWQIDFDSFYHSLSARTMHLLF